MNINKNDLYNINKNNNLRFNISKLQIDKYLDCKNGPGQYLYLSDEITHKSNPS
jgi:hypothetical protein